MNKIIVTTAVTLTSLCATAFGQTISNGDFSNVTPGEKNSSFQTEAGIRALSIGGSVADWTLTPTTTYIQYGKNTNNALLLQSGDTRGEGSGGGVFEPGPRIEEEGDSVGNGGTALSSAFRISVAGTYSVSFTTMSGEGDSTASISLHGVNAGALGETQDFTEKADGFASNRTFNFKVTDKEIEKSKGEFQLEFVNKSRSGMVIDNVQFTPEPSSALLLGFAGVAALTRRKR